MITADVASEDGPYYLPTQGFAERSGELHDLSYERNNPNPQVKCFEKVELSAVPANRDTWWSEVRHLIYIHLLAL